MIHRLIARWWPPYLRSEIALLRASLRLANERLSRCQQARVREASDRMSLLRRFDQQQFDAELTDFIARDAAHKRLADGQGDPE